MSEDMDAVAVGDTVHVSDGSRVRGESAGTGRVVKVGRTLVHVERDGQVTTYYRDTRQRRDGYSGWFRTAARAADDAVRVNALVTLKVHGVEVGWREIGAWTTAQLVKLATFVDRIKA